jgi:histidinol-phosphate aminotransferase
MTGTYERPTAGRDALRLHLNENTAGCSPRVVEALRALDSAAVAFYPEYDETIDRCAEHFGVPRDELLLTNGLDEGILATCVSYLRHPRTEALVVEPSFDMYRVCTGAVGGRVVTIPPRADFTFPLEELLDAITGTVGVVFLTNPNNPTGLAIPRASLVRILEAAAPGAIVFLDEAYADFSGETMVRQVRQHPNLIVGRTFAKAHGLAGIRIGAVVAAVGTLAPLRQVVPPYSINACANVALRAALADRAFFEWYLDQVRESKRLLYECCARLGLPCLPSAANFVLVHVGDRAAEVVERVARRGIAIRDRSGDPGCAGYVRITTGVVAHTRMAIEAVEEAWCGAA